MAKQPVRPIRSSVCTIRHPVRGLMVSVRAKRSERDPQETSGGLTAQAVAPLVEKPRAARRVLVAKSLTREIQSCPVAGCDRDQCSVEVVPGAVG